MFRELSNKQRALYYWYDIPEWQDKQILIATGAIRTGKTVIGSYAFLKYAMKMVKETTNDNIEKGYNLFAVISMSEALALLNIVENWINRLELKGFTEVRTYNEFELAPGNVFLHRRKPIGLLEIKDHLGNITRFIYLGADNKRAMNRVTGLTLRGWFLDEGALLGGNEEDNIKFIERMIERTSSFRTNGGRPLQMITTNPQSGEDGLFYQSFIKGGWSKGILVMSFRLIDNPTFTQEDIDYYKKVFTDSQYRRKILGEWVRDNETLVYPRFNKETHCIAPESILKNEIVELAVGVDEGQRDARAFVLAGFARNYEQVIYLDEYYHRNKEGVEPKDVNDYVKDFFAKLTEWYGIYRKPMNVYVDSASLYLIVLLKKEAANHKIPVTIAGVNKTAINSSASSAVQERIDFTNMLLGTGKIFYNTQCKLLIEATNKAIKKDGDRIDDGKTNNVDILDASEYAVKHRMRVMTDKIMYRNKVKNND
jgi:PBSX family phage terminase large subunit